MTPWYLRTRLVAAWRAFVAPVLAPDTDDAVYNTWKALLQAYAQHRHTDGAVWSAALHRLAIDRDLFTAHSQVLPRVAERVWADIDPAVRGLMLSPGDMLATLIAEWSVRGHEVPDVYRVAVAQWAEHLHPRGGSPPPPTPVVAPPSAEVVVEHGPGPGMLWSSNLYPAGSTLYDDPQE